MYDVLNGLRKIINRWVNTESPILEPISVGDRLISLRTSHRFRPGDDVLITDGSEFEYPHMVVEIPDSTHVVLQDGVRFSDWNIGNCSLRKAVRGQFVQGIYLGDPDSIIKYPAITVNAKNKSSEWIGLEVTKETYDVDITCYVQDATQEDGYEFLLHLTRIVETGLKKNPFPVVGDRSYVPLLAAVYPGDTYIRIADTDGITPDQFILFDSVFQSEDAWVAEIVDGQVIRLREPLRNSYPLDSDPQVIIINRFLFKAWPKSIDYGFVHKTTLLKASKISWSAEEAEMQMPYGWGDSWRPPPQ
jgi:hypothetical protein